MEHPQNAHCNALVTVRIWVNVQLRLTSMQKTTYPPEKNYEYRNTCNLIKTRIIVMISKSGQGKAYIEYETGKNPSYNLVARQGS